MRLSSVVTWFNILCQDQDLLLAGMTGDMELLLSALEKGANVNVVGKVKYNVF